MKELKEYINKIKSFLQQQCFNIFSFTLIVIISVGFSLLEVCINHNQDKINIVGTLSAIGTLTIAYFSWRAYSTIIEEKINEIQFSRVLKLLKNIEDNNIYIKADLSGFGGIERATNLQELSKPYETIKRVEGYEKIVNLFQKNTLDFDYSTLSISLDTLDFFISLYQYSNYILMPEIISKKLKAFYLDIQRDSILEAQNKFIRPEDQNIENQTPPYEYYIRSWDFNSQQFSEKKAVQIYNPITLYKDKRELKEANIIHVSLLYQYANIRDDKESAYYSWKKLRQSCKEVMDAIEDWLKTHNANDTNLRNNLPITEN